MVGSAVERFSDKEEVIGSTPIPPTCLLTVSLVFVKIVNSSQATKFMRSRQTRYFSLRDLFCGGT